MEETTLVYTLTTLAPTLDFCLGGNIMVDYIFINS